MLTASALRLPFFLSVLAAAFVTAACRPETSGTPRSATNTPRASSPVARETASLSSTPESTGIQAIEVPDEELERHRLLTIGWRTDFARRSVRLHELQRGGPGRDDIPAISRPHFQSVTDADEWLDDREPVQVVEIAGDARAYPQQILIWHEIVNDIVGGEPIAITY